jgi:hypothetical protein
MGATEESARAIYGQVCGVVTACHVTCDIPRHMMAQKKTAGVLPAVTLGRGRLGAYVFPRNNV